MDKEEHLLLSDSSPAMLELLSGRLTQDGLCPHTISGPDDISPLLESFPVSAVLLDADIFGNELLPITRRLHETRELVILLSASYPPSFDAAAAIDSGADDVLFKPLEPREFCARLRARLRRFKKEACFGEADAILRYGDLTLDTDSLTLYKGNVSLPVTLSEYKLLVKLMRSPGKTFSKRELYAYISCGSKESSNILRSDDNTVMVHISKLRDKIEDDPRDPKFIKTVRGRGYRFEAPLLGLK